MELVDMEDHNSHSNISYRITRREKNRFYLLRKFAVAICILESVAIALFIAYQLTRTTLPPATSSLGYPPNPLISFYRTYSNGINATRINTGLVNGCNQRLHDLKFSVICESKHTETCQLLSLPKVENLVTASEPLVATIITTSKSGKRFQTKLTTLKKITCKPDFDGVADSIQENLSPCRFKTRLNVYLTESQQEIIGWGGALTDSSINNILSLSTNGTRRLLDDYFGADGLKFNIIRITIGGSDFSSRFYTNDDIVPNGTKNEDLELEKFKLMEEDVLYKIPMIKLIQNEYKYQDRGELKLFASMWSPPVWMKTNEHFNKGTLKGSISSNLEQKTDNEQYFKALAELKKKFLLSYRANSINFWAFTVMNEPFLSVQPFITFNTMIFPNKDYANYIAKYLGPTIREDERLKHIKLLVHDDNRKYLMSFTDPVLSQPEVRRYIDGVAVHGYIDEDYQLMDEILEKHKLNQSDFFILPTELCSGHLPFMDKAMIGNWHRGVHYALDIIHSLQHSASGWIDWNMALDLTGGPGWLGGRLDSPVIVDKTEDLYHKSPMFYVLGHFSRYIPPKSFKLRATIVNDKYDYHFETVTFLLPNQQDLATIILNHNPYPVELNIRLIDKFGKNDVFNQVNCEADSITTVVYSRNLNLAE